MSNIREWEERREDKEWEEETDEGREPGDEREETGKTHF